ncbi:MAG: hypothetical protein IJJ33_11680 [Victivallales bacterium]|nr:hypothetical protein [Victivallales bacterium]
MNNPNDFEGSDSRRIGAAILAALHSGERRVTIPARRPDTLAERDYWLIDEAILLPDGMELVLDGCRVKLSDQARDNFIRTSNCGFGVTQISPVRRVRVVGRGNAVLEGADHPRATGDAGKGLGVRTYGTDAGKPGEKQTGDWRNVGVLLVRAEDFLIENLTIRNYHCWGISLEKCANGKVRGIRFETREKRLVDGVLQPMLNQDGLDIRKGCHHLEIEDITGQTGDDVVALTAIHPEIREIGAYTYTEVSGCPEPLSDNDIHDIRLRHIHGYSTGGHQIVRLLNSCGLKLYNIDLEDVRDTSADAESGVVCAVAVKIGDKNVAWGGVTPLGDTFNIRVRQVDSRCRQCVLIAGSLCDSTITDVINRNVECEAVSCSSGSEYMRNVTVINAVTSAE